jgi:putative NADH-flavin reductase
MKILLFGISGRTGRLVATEALRRGHKIAGIARDPGRVNIPGAEVMAGTPYDYETVRKAIEGCDAVVSTMNIFPSDQGLFSKLTTPADVMSVSVGNAVRLMKENGLKRIVVMTALGVGDSAKEVPLFFRILIKISNIGIAYKDHVAQETILEDSGLDWTVVRPVQLTDNNDDTTVIYKLGNNGKIKSSVSRNAVAHFILDCLEKGEFIGKKPGISNS